MFNLNEWAGVLGPEKSKAQTMYYTLKLQSDTVILVGPSPGMRKEFAREEFQSLLEEGKWLLATDSPEDEGYHTPDGFLPY